MQHNRLTIWIVMLAALACLVFVGCGDDDDSNPTGSSGTNIRMPGIQQVTVPAALTNQQNAAGQLASGTMNMANEFTTYWDQYVNAYDGWTAYDGSWSWSPKQQRPDMAQSDSIAYIYSDQYYTIIYTMIETPTSYVWAIVMGSNAGSLEKVIEATEAKDGLSGSFAYFSGGVEYMTWSWSIDVSNTYTMQIEASDGSFDFVCVVYSSGAGYMQSFENAIPTWKLSWNASGTDGEWWIYDEYGNVEDHGTTWSDFYWGTGVSASTEPMIGR